MHSISVRPSSPVADNPSLCHLPPPLPAQSATVLACSLDVSPSIPAVLLCELLYFSRYCTIRWGNNGNSDRLYFLGLQNPADGDCSHSIKRCLLLGRKSMINLDSILKSRDITLPTMVCLVKAMVFPVVMCGCESWIIKKAEHLTIDAFELWCWRRLLRVPWNARRSNQSILKEISPEYTLEGLMLKLKLQHFKTSIFWPPDVKTWLIGKDPDAGKDWRREEKGMTEDEMVGWHHRLDEHEFEQAPGIGDGQGGLACCSPWGCKELEVTEWLNWTVL